MSDEYVKALELVERMDEEELENCWRAIWNGGLDYKDYMELVNNIPRDDWIEMVHGEVNRRKFKKVQES